MIHLPRFSKVPLDTVATLHEVLVDGNRLNTVARQGWVIAEIGQRYVLPP